MKVAALQYSYEPFADFSDYQQKITTLVDRYAEQGVQVLLFPEYAGVEMHTFAPSLQEMEDYLPDYLALFKHLSLSRRMMICTGSLVVRTPEGVFNRSYLFSPNGKMGIQDKCNLIPSEVEEGFFSSGNTLHVFETSMGKVGICICYDVEFPSLVRQYVEADVSLILVPSYTKSVRGFHRVMVSCRARAVENQCFVLQAAMVGQTDTDLTYGAAVACSPIDEGFPEEGILAMGKRDQEGGIVVDLDMKQLQVIRQRGEVHNHLDNTKWSHRFIKREVVDLR